VLDVLATVQRGESFLDRFDEARLFLQQPADRFLGNRLYLAAGAVGNPDQLASCSAVRCTSMHPI